MSAARALGAAILNSLSCAAMAAGSGPIDPAFDFTSYANVDQFKTTGVELDLRVIFKFKQIAGSVTLELKRLDPRSTQLVLDTKDLMILDVTQKATDVLGATAKNQTLWVSRPFHLEKADPILGSALVIELPPSKKGTESIKIDYETTDKSSALQCERRRDVGGGHEDEAGREQQQPGDDHGRGWDRIGHAPDQRE